MDAFNEAVERSAYKRAIELGATSPQAFRELSLRVKEDPSRYITDAPERALLVLDNALKTYDRERANDEYLDDADFFHAFQASMAALAASCDEALALDPHCLDASVIKLVATATPPDERVRAVNELLKPPAGPSATKGPTASPEAPEAALPTPPEGSSPQDQSSEASKRDLYEQVFARPSLRALAAEARWAFAASLHKRAVLVSKKLLELSPSDTLGTRFTLALAFARLEDEASLEALDRAFERQGNAWIALARALLLFKLDRLSAAHRALSGYIAIYESGAFVLSHPAFVNPYLPDRPAFAPRSLDEVTFAVHEAEPLITDTPDFIGWCHDQEGFDTAALAFAQRMGFDF